VLGIVHLMVVILVFHVGRGQNYGGQQREDDNLPETQPAHPFRESSK
jgi:hypothetical protein